MDEKTVKKGDVVLVEMAEHLPDGRPVRRPGVVISANRVNDACNTVAVVPLVGGVNRDPDPWSFVVEMSSHAGQLGGLRMDSRIDCSVVYSVPKRDISKIGHFPDETLSVLDECIRIVFSLDEAAD